MSKLGLGRPSGESRADRPTRSQTLEDSQGTGKLNVDGKEDGYFYYIENDEKGNIEALQKRGFEIVEKDSGTTMSSSNPKEVGSRIETTVFNSDGTKGVLMRQRKEWHEEDMKFKAEVVSKREEALFRNEQKEEGRYGSIKVE